MPPTPMPVVAMATEPEMASTRSRSRWVRGFWLLVAVLSLGLACVGLVVPGLPSTEFVLLSAWAAARSSTRFHQWLLHHRLFGTMLRHWQQGKMVSRKAKWAATASMSACAVLMVLTVPHPWFVAAAIACMVGVQAWLWRRPEPDNSNANAMGRSVMANSETRKGTKTMGRFCIMLAALLGASGVVMGAYTAHGLSFIASPEAREAARASMHTAVNYQLLHSVVLLAVGLWFRLTGGNRILVAAALLFLAGILLFSGLIYLQTLTSIQTLRPFVPWGGSSLILAWLTLGVAAWGAGGKSVQ